jgi:N-acetylmuramic acid 6-phosphate (MurNAc-6-P) etherase
MLRDLTGRDDDAIRAALEAAGGRVKTAVLVLHGLDRQSADALLARHAGHLHAALAEVTK